MHRFTYLYCTPLTITIYININHAFQTGKHVTIILIFCIEHNWLVLLYFVKCLMNRQLYYAWSLKNVDLFVIRVRVCFVCKTLARKDLKMSCDTPTHGLVMILPIIKICIFPPAKYCTHKWINCKKMDVFITQIDSA